MLNELILVEEIPVGFAAGPCDPVVALTARACLALDRLGQPYRLVTDFGSEEMLADRQGRFWKEELAWLDRLDSLLRQRLPELEERGISPSILYGYRLKMLLDSLFIRGTEIEAMLGGGCRKVRHWASGDSLVSRLLPLYCASRAISCEAAAVRSARAGKTARFSAARLLDLLQAGAREAVPALRRRRWSRLSTGEGQLTLLFMETGFHMSDLVEEALRAGHHCLVRRGNRIQGFSRGKAPRDWTFPAGALGPGMADRFRDAAERLLAPGSPLWAWPDGWFGIPMAPLLREPLARWIREDLPRSVCLSDAFLRFFGEEGVDFVLFSSLLDPLQIGAAAACRRPGGAESVLVAHGEGMEVAEAWDLHELYPYRHYFVPSGELAAYFRGRASIADRPAASVHVGSCRWPRYSELARRPRLYLERWDGRLRICRNRPPLGLPPDQSIVLFPSIWPKRDERYLHLPDFQETWYFDFQKALIRVFAEFPKIRFVVKLFPKEDLRFSPIGEYIRRLGADNLFLSRAPLAVWYPWTDRLILDNPSTYLYEAALAGVPFRLFLHRGWPIRPSALEQVRPWVTSFDRPGEAAEAVRAYLKVPAPEKLILRPEGEPIIRSLEELSLQKADSLQAVPA